MAFCNEYHRDVRVLLETMRGGSFALAAIPEFGSADHKNEFIYGQ